MITKNLEEITKENQIYSELIKIQNSEKLRKIAKKADAWIYIWNNFNDERLMYDRGVFIKRECDPSNGDASCCSFDSYNYIIKDNKLVVKCTYICNRKYDELLMLYPDLNIEKVKEIIKNYFVEEKGLLNENEYDEIMDETENEEKNKREIYVKNLENEIKEKREQIRLNHLMRDKEITAKTLKGQEALDYYFGK